MGLRFEVGPGAAVHSPLATKNGFLHLVLQGCDLELLTSVLNGLGPFFEDEAIPVVVPMQIELLTSRITLKVRETLGFHPRLYQARNSGSDSFSLLLCLCKMSEEKHIRILCQCYSSIYICVVKKPHVQARNLVCISDLVLGLQRGCVKSLVYLILFHHLWNGRDSLLPLTPCKNVWINNDTAVLQADGRSLGYT